MSKQQENNRKKILATAKKLKALADRGIDGEKENAQAMYREFCKKHGINELERVFKITFPEDLTVLTNVVLSVNPFAEFTYAAQYVKVELDDEDYAECVKKFSHFIKIYRIERDMLDMAFFAKHDTWFKPDAHAQTKYKDKLKVNEMYAQARAAADALNAQYAKKPKIKAYDADNMDEEAIKLMNLERIQKVVPEMLDAKYKSTR